MRRRLWLAVAGLLVTGCIDGSVRPRPGTTTEPDEPDASLFWFDVQPRVITHGQTDSVRLTIALEGEPQTVHVQLRTGALITVPRAANNTYAVSLPVASLLLGYRVADLHYNGAVLLITSQDGSSESYPVFLNVRDVSVPGAEVRALAPGVQSSAHVVNIRYDDLFVGSTIPTAVLRAFYDEFTDDYTFVAVVSQVSAPRERSYQPVRNTTRGLGQQLFDNGSTYGSAAKLEGIIGYPDAAFFDLAETGNLHDIAHRWMNWSTVSSIAIGKPHWPLSTFANGVMGFQDAFGRRVLPFVFTKQPDDTYRVDVAETPRRFNDLELYYMGLLPGDSVAQHVVFLNQAQQSQFRQGGVLSGTLDTVTVAKIVARDAARVPSSTTSPKSFRLTTIVLSRNGLLSNSEMSFFEYMAARGEAREPLPYSMGGSSGTTLPFYLATGQRATLITSLSTVTEAIR